MKSNKLLAAALLTVSAIAHADMSATPLWETTAEFRAPESVLPDLSRQRMYVSNVDGGPTEKDGKGFISLLGTDGAILTLEWVTGMNAPKGMAQIGHRLFVSDIDELVEIDVEKAAITHRYPAREAIFLNDVTADAEGNVYVSDMLTNRIYQLKGNQLSAWLESSELANPNGVKVQGNQLYVASWGVMEPGGFTTKVPGHISVVSLADRKISDFGGDQSVGNLDGIEFMADGSALVTDWIAGGLFNVKADGTVKSLQKLPPGSADIGYDIEQGIVLVPMMNDGKVIALSLK